MASHLTDEAHGQPYIDENASMTAEKENPGESKDVFVEDEAHQIQYKTLSWQVRPSSSLHAVKSWSKQFVSLLMIAEIVSNGMLSLPSALAVVGELYDWRTAQRTTIDNSLGIVPAVILIVFLGIFGLYTAKLLVDFKLNHHNVHTMGTQFSVIEFHPLDVL
jgi:hypothetical protein